MWYVYDKQTTVILKTCKTVGAARGWITKKHKEFLREEKLWVSDSGPLFDWAAAEAVYFHTRIEKPLVRENLKFQALHHG